ncbi:MAG TPA: diacylglycerol kinase family protein [Candidatus Saccharimonadales bacterium]|nr:diacylglycerol kinase family protein [Candidatus Saccharimonadales bacterium]
MDKDQGNLYRFEKLIIIYNPASTNSRRSRRRISELKELFPSKEVIVTETSPDGYDANRKIVVGLAKKFTKKTLVCIAAGDGTVSAVLDALLLSKSVSGQSKKVPILPLWGGNANDLAYMINGRPNKLSLKAIFEKGNVVPIYPLNVKLSNNNDLQQKIAACYVSFGASAYATQQAELPKNKKMKIHIVPGVRMLSEMMVVTKSLVRAKPFTIQVNGKSQPMFERIFVNGSRIAKVDRLPIKLNEKAFYEAMVEQKHPKAIISLLSALKILRNRTYGEITGEDRNFTLNEDTWSQIDGEVMNLSKGTKVDISLSKNPFYVLSTKL